MKFTGARRRKAVYASYLGSKPLSSEPPLPPDAKLHRESHSQILWLCDLGYSQSRSFKFST